MFQNHSLSIIVEIFQILAVFEDLFLLIKQTLTNIMSALVILLLKNIYNYLSH